MGPCYATYIYSLQSESNSVKKFYKTTGNHILFRKQAFFLVSWRFILEDEERRCSTWTQ